MLTFFSVLEGALNELEENEGVQPDEVHEVDIDLCVIGKTQCASVNFSEWNYMCFTYSDWQPGDFIGYRTDKCYYCSKNMEECDCDKSVA